MTYRVYDTQAYQWVTDYYIDHEGNVGHLDYRSGDITFYEEFKLMERLEIKDKNDIYIYEGDILKVRFYSDNSTIIVKVVYSPEDAAFVLMSLNGKSGSYMYDCEFSEYEVIGNIYDNPEFLCGK